MFTAALTGSSIGSTWAESDSARSVGGAVLKHRPRLHLMRDPCSELRSTRTPRPYDLQQACGTGLQSTIAVANESASVKYDRRRRRPLTHLGCAHRVR